MRIRDWSSDVCSSDLGRDPGKAPAHAPLEGGNPLVGRARDGDERKVRVLEVLARRIDMVGLEGAAGATLLPVRAEHEVLHEELAAPGEEIAQRDRPVRPLDRKSTRLNSSH